MRSDTWDSGNHMTCFREKTALERCPCCNEFGNEVFENSQGREYAKTCRTCGGTKEVETTIYL